ncbi:connector enhancer of kinase suppressor of ras 2-like isoform X1 [Lates japonicus]|uniref:Connector enhancer of kinase suppressor of ras 2-like isoform X1 n=1 Tax=Lates japonicus TaxID=270547 RepID=A0AAD3M476_LATJO|nr:connector enhancer of kinase suppressor of ras 2-like isoform X1 [Lates japonicus]
MGSKYQSSEAGDKGNLPGDDPQSDVHVAEGSESPNSYLDQECRRRFPLVEEDAILYCYEYDQNQDVSSVHEGSTPPIVSQHHHPHTPQDSLAVSEFFAAFSSEDKTPEDFLLGQPEQNRKTERAAHPPFGPRPPDGRLFVYVSSDSVISTMCWRFAAVKVKEEE